MPILLILPLHEFYKIEVRHTFGKKKSVLFIFSF